MICVSINIYEMDVACSMTVIVVPDDTQMVNYLVPGFWGKFIELHKVMWKVNEGLTQSHPYQSRPSSWPMLRRGISFWANQGRHIYFLGNPIVYWMTTVAVFNFLILWAFFQVRAKLGYTDDHKGRFKPEKKKKV